MWTGIANPYCYTGRRFDAETEIYLCWPNPAGYWRSSYLQSKGSTIDQMFSQLRVDRDSCDWEGYGKVNLFGNFHELLTCKKHIADSAIQILQQRIPGLEVRTIETIRTKHVRDTTIALSVRRGSENVDIGIVTGDPHSEEGPYDGECWIFVDAAFSLLRSNRRLAKNICSILEEFGANR